MENGVAFEGSWSGAKRWGGRRIFNRIGEDYIGPRTMTFLSMGKVSI
jgi:hypothetical protein